MKLVIDTRLVASRELLDDLSAIAKAHKLYLLTADVVGQRRAHDSSILAILSLATAMTSLIVAILRWIQDRETTWTAAELAAEMDAALRLRGITEYRVLKLDGYEHLVSRSGKPCRVEIQSSDGKELVCFVGVTREIIVVAPDVFDHRLY